MGNTSVVATGVKNQADNDSKQLYQLVNLRGGGELVELMKRARWTKNYKEIDEKLKNEVKGYLYNDGKGKKVPIVDLIMARNKDRQKSKIKVGKEKQKKAKELAMIDMILQDGESTGTYMQHKPQDEGHSLLENPPAAIERKYREVCWELDSRGQVGETILHLCLLNSSAIHADLAKRLLRLYPQLLNDIYNGEEYYGENCLHMAITNEDPAMVKFLLDLGADYHGRCCGNFFCPDDQKDSRTDSLDHECVQVCEKTNYEGHVYLGEYPLSFAACLGQEECVRLLIAKGADPNLQDNNGNTVMHMLVIHDKKTDKHQDIKEMFDLLHGLGARLDIKNRQGLTPLTLSSKLSRKDMYEHILEIEREVFWLFGNVTCAGYPLEDIDTISSTGEINKDSALNLIVYGEEEGHLDMMDGLVVNLLKEKWKTFARFRFYRRFLCFGLYFLTFVVAFALRPGKDLCAYANSTTTLHGCKPMNENRTMNPCYLLQPYRTNDIVRLVLESMVLIGAMVYIFLAMKEIYHQGFRIFFTTLRGAPAKALFLCSCIFVLMMLPGRAFCFHEYEDIMGVLAILCTAPYSLFFCRGFRIVGPFVVMIYKMIKGDLLRFFIIYAVFVIGFSQAIYVPFRNKSSVFASPIEAIFGMFAMSVGDFEDLYEDFEVKLQTPFKELAGILFMAYMIMVTLLLVNMLIAMMGNTYQVISETQKEWFRQWAKIVLVVEQSVTTDERRLQQFKYSQPMADGRRALVIRWHQSEKEKEELKRLRELHKQQQEKLRQQKRRLSIKKRNTPSTLIYQEVNEGTYNL
ncbi:transient receptor potential cation channel subfamily V member 5-like isoform X3 [Haliotis rufescens]|uniref:transient receptor potential cation channel subfamily V member 5-like isoform X3 n=1 Tax=Haliotis rufescens TaxID=6454 RepID=UPI00201EF8D8|nr:transient receptor potential cation channel subfamily V member 5-like isoform X3 [Haliotis rufescens]